MNNIHLNFRENWYRDVWLLVITGLVLLTVITQNNDRKAAERANVEARYSDCTSGNETRIVLRKQVEQSKLERPLLLKLLPEFDKPQILKLIEKNEQEELAGFAPKNCIEVAEEALPGHRKRYTIHFP